MGKKICILLTGLLSVGLFVWGNSAYAVLPEDINTWTNCGLREMQSNNVPSQSKKFSDVQTTFTTTYNKREYSNRPWSPQKGLRKDCTNVDWFNNQSPQWDIFWQNGEKNGTKTDDVKEWECYEKFLTVASDENNYGKTHDAANPSYPSGKAYYVPLDYFPTDPASLRPATDTEAAKAKVVAAYVKSINKEKGDKSSFYASGAPKSWADEGLTKPYSFTYRDIWFLQAAINEIGCGQIKQDGALGNYTIKSFCECAKPPVKVEQACVQLESDPTDATDKIRYIFPAVTATQKLAYAGCSIAADGAALELPISAGVGATCAPIVTTPTLKACCPSKIPPKKIPSVDNAVNCCIDPSKDKDKLDASCEIDKYSECGPNTSLPSCDVGGVEVPFCPCSNGSAWKRNANNERECPCTIDTNEELQKCDNFANQTTCAADLVCLDVDNKELGKTCPCPAGGDWKRADTTSKRDCPCTIDSNEELQTCTNLKDLNYCNPGTTKCEKDIDGKPATLDICPCDGGKSYVKKDNVWKCDDCKEGEKRSASKGKCVCDPNKQCCGIKLNTNVPFIGRCINFAAENDKDAVYTDEYGNGNTTITTNALNAFPLLMTGLGKILLTLILLASFGILVYAGMRMTMHGADSNAFSDAKGLIIKVIVGIALLGASGVILHAINPNFFQ